MSDCLIWVNFEVESLLSEEFLKIRLNSRDTARATDKNDLVNTLSLDFCILKGFHAKRDALLEEAISNLFKLLTSDFDG
jgi:hypothetical protein